jgi:hypothetical protein
MTISKPPESPSKIFDECDVPDEGDVLHGAEGVKGMFGSVGGQPVFLRSLACSSASLALGVRLFGVRLPCRAVRFGSRDGLFPVQHGNLVLQGMDFVQEDFAEELELFVLESGFGDVLFALVEVQLFAFELCDACL